MFVITSIPPPPPPPPPPPATVAALAPLTALELIEAPMEGPLEAALERPQSPLTPTNDVYMKMLSFVPVLF